MRFRPTATRKSIALWRACAAILLVAASISPLSSVFAQRSGVVDRDQLGGAALRLDQRTVLGTHNSYANPGEGITRLVANQGLSTAEQIFAGVRHLNPDTYLVRQKRLTSGDPVEVYWSSDFPQRQGVARRGFRYVIRGTARAGPTAQLPELGTRALNDRPFLLPPSARPPRRVGGRSCAL